MEDNINQKILLVDDKPENLLVLETVLEDSHREFVKANSGKEALRYLIEDDYALILLDVQMPEMDGFETAALIRSRDKSKTIPIIFVTAISNEEKNVFRGYEAGAVDFMHKPVNENILRSKVKIFLELDRQKRMLEQRNQELIFAKINTDSILTNIKEGLFLLDSNYIIQPQYSAALEKILEKEGLGNANFFSIIKPHIDGKACKDAHDYLDLLFKEQVNENDFQDLNPLMNIEFCEVNGKNPDKKYLSFFFKRINKDYKISGVMVTVTDNTENVLLEQKLKYTEAQSRKQIKLIEIFQSEPHLLREFLIQTDKELILIEKEIKKLSSSKNILYPLENIYRAIHSLKGNATLLNFDFIVYSAHQVEDLLKEFRENLKVKSNDKLQLLKYVQEMHASLQEMYTLITNLKQFCMNFDNKNNSCGELLLRAIDNLILRFNGEFNKNIEFKYPNFKTESIQSGDFNTIKDILIQLVRNAIYHGIEDPQERKKKGKNTEPYITLSSEIQNNNLKLILKDDGRGLQIEKIKEKAKSLGKWPAAQVEKWDNEEIADLIFESGISTSENSTVFAGRGMGMQIIKHKIDELGGSIRVNFEKEKYCEFIVSIPHR